MGRPVPLPGAQMSAHTLLEAYESMASSVIFDGLGIEGRLLQQNLPRGRILAQIVDPVTAESHAKGLLPSSRSR